MNRTTPVININFARTDFRAVAVARAVLLGLAAVSAVVLVLLVFSTRSLRMQAQEAEKRVQELTASEAKLRPVMDERKQLVDNLNAMTGLLQARKFSWTRFLSRLEDAFPEGIALTKLDLKPKEQTAALDGFAQSPEALSKLMIGLQQSRSFKNPLLKRQSMDKGILTFNVLVNYSENPADGAVAGTDRQPDR